MGQEKQKSYPPERPYAKKSLGQNFLVDTNIVERIVSSLGLSKDDRVIEIGPGRGALTGRLLETGAVLTAIEIDRDLAGILREEFGSRDNFRLLEGDFLRIELREILNGVGSGGAKIVANLPYYVSTPILRRLFEQREAIGDMVVMLQKEVAERITAAPGDSSRGFLTVMLERGFESEILFNVSKGAFRPVPNVESAVVRLKTKQVSHHSSTEDKAFIELASAAFAQKRKTLKNNLRSASANLRKLIETAGGTETVLRKADIDPGIRAEAVTPDEWQRLAGAIQE